MCITPEKLKKKTKQKNLHFEKLYSISSASSEKSRQAGGQTDSKYRCLIKYRAIGS